MRVRTNKINSEKLRNMVEERGLRNDFIANKIGITSRTFSDVLRGKINPSIPVIKLICVVLSANEEDLIIK